MHEFSAGWWAAQKGGPASCTTGQASGLHIKTGWRLHSKLGCVKRWAGGLPFSEAHPALFRSPPAFLCSPPARPSVFCAACQTFTFFIWKHGPPMSVIPSSIWNQCCHSVMKKNPRIYLEKKTESNKKTQTYKMYKEVKTKLEMYASGTCT